MFTAPLQPSSTALGQFLTLQSNPANLADPSCQESGPFTFGLSSGTDDPSIVCEVFCIRPRPSTANMILAK